MLTKEFKRGYSEGGLQPKKKEAPPIVPEIYVEPKAVTTKPTTTEPFKSTADEKTPLGNRESCPICLELISTDVTKFSFYPCCANVICAVCSGKCHAADQRCPLCRVLAPTTQAEHFAQLQGHVAKGNKAAQYQLGMMYEDGQLGLKKSIKRAAKLYELSAVQGYGPAQFNLGVCYEHGSGVKMDKKKALKYYSLASEQEYAEAQYNCGGMYYRGDGVERDVEKALRLLEAAAAQGLQQAQDMLAGLRAAQA